MVSATSTGAVHVAAMRSPLQSGQGAISFVRRQVGRLDYRSKLPPEPVSEAGAGGPQPWQASEPCQSRDNRRVVAPGDRASDRGPWRRSPGRRDCGVDSAWSRSRRRHRDGRIAWVRLPRDPVLRGDQVVAVSMQSNDGSREAGRAPDARRVVPVLSDKLRRRQDACCRARRRLGRRAWRWAWRWIRCRCGLARGHGCRAWRGHGLDGAGSRGRARELRCQGRGRRRRDARRGGGTGCRERRRLEAARHRERPGGPRPQPELAGWSERTSDRECQHRGGEHDRADPGEHARRAPSSGQPVRCGRARRDNVHGGRRAGRATRGSGARGSGARGSLGACRGSGAEGRRSAHGCRGGQIPRSASRDATPGAPPSSTCPAAVARIHTARRTHRQPDVQEVRCGADQIAAAFAERQGWAAGRRSQPWPARWVRSRTAASLLRRSRRWRLVRDGLVPSVQRLAGHDAARASAGLVEPRRPSASSTDNPNRSHGRE